MSWQNTRLPVGRRGVICPLPLSGGGVSAGGGTRQLPEHAGQREPGASARIIWIFRMRILSPVLT